MIFRVVDRPSDTGFSFAEIVLNMNFVYIFANVLSARRRVMWFDVSVNVERGLGIKSNKVPPSHVLILLILSLSVGSVRVTLATESYENGATTLFRVNNIGSL